MKVYSGTIDGRRSYCVGASSLKAVRDILKQAGITNVSLHYLRNYWSVSRNAEQVAAAERHPGVLLVEGRGYRHEYEPYSGTRESAS